MKFSSDFTDESLLQCNNSSTVANQFCYTSIREEIKPISANMCYITHLKHNVLSWFVLYLVIDTNTPDIQVVHICTFIGDKERIEI